MKKNILLLSIFCTLQLSALKEPFNPETFGLSQAEYDQLKKEYRVGWKQIVNYLQLGDSEKVEAAIRAHRWKVAVFNKGYITEENAKIAIHLRSCESCTTLGELVDSSNLLTNTFPKIAAAQKMYTREKHIEEARIKVQQLEAETRKARQNLNKEIIAMNESQHEQNTPEQNPFFAGLKRLKKTLKSLSSDQGSFFLKSAHYSPYCSSHDFSFFSE